MERPQGKIDIKKFLPHRPPVLLVTNMPFIDNESVITEFEISDDCIFVKDGFFSETGIIENAAQTSSAIVGQSYYDTDDYEGVSNNLIGYISAIKKAVIHQLPKVGDTLTSKAKLVSRYDSDDLSICTINCSSFRNDDLIVDCTMNFLIHEVR
ncbi:ABC transporter permease [Aurantibacter crassamenti]|uniref:ABC transporter permease n=1 Tax=Aurantibacter crassamenti TaxID=1837375 RepID=UPI0019394417|nr:ABC transporter permease [Aurantibacter crassamenti]MBM1105527.1 ABC transporter permease [Aurantibacter crassamenti]